MPRNMRQLIATVRSLLHRPPYATVLKWDRNQPRGPKGSPTGGRWVKGVSAGMGSYPQVGQPGQEMYPGDGRRIRQNMSVTPGMERTLGQANYADIMNAPTGEGFHNRPRGVGIPEPKAEPMSTGDPKVLSALKEGTVTDSRPLGGGANASVIVTMDDGTEAVYKPERGENWTASFCNHDINEYVTNHDFSLAARETFAFEVDTALGLGIVPETVLRERVDETNISVNTAGDEYDGGGYDSYEARQAYDEYREQAQEDVMDAVGEEMGQLFEDAQKEHVKDIENRAQEVLDIWNEEKKDFPEQTPYGSGSMLRGHPVLPMGSAEGFERREVTTAELDPLEVLDEAQVDVTAGLSESERKRVREVLRQRLEDGYREFGEVDDDAARDHLDRDKWLEDHQDTEAQMYESKIQTFDSWRRSHGYGSDQGGGGDGEDRNQEAPHPHGGSFQNFRKNADSYGDMSAEDGARLAVLDYVIGTMDRHGQNLMFENDRPVAIDNGYSMPGGMDSEDDFTFRSAGVDEWLSSSKSRNVPEEVRAQLHDAMENTDWNALVARHPGMSQDEREAFLSRVNNMTIALQTQEGLRELWKQQQRM